MAVTTNFSGILRQLSDSFEEVFQFTPRGCLRADRTSLNRISQWWNNNRLLVTLVTGVDTFDVVFLHQGQGDIGTRHDNAKMVLHVYALAYAAYVKCCQTISREIHVAHRLLQLENVELEEPE
jgi:hypothetical protein